MRRNRELEMERKIYKHFRVGMVQNANFDTMSVTVSASLDFDTLNSREVSSRRRTVKGRFCKTLETLEEKLQSGEGASRLALTAILGPPPIDRTSGESTTRKSKTLKSDSLTKRNRNQKALGKLVPEETTATITLWYGHIVETAEALTSEYIEQIKQDASNAIGIPKNNISVSIQKLVPEAEPEVKFADNLNRFIEQYGLYILYDFAASYYGRTACSKEEEGRRAGTEPAFEGPQFVIPKAEDEFSGY